MTRMQTNTPVRKVSAATISSALAVIVLYFLAQFTGAGEPGDDIQAATTTIITAIVTFLAGYFTPPSPVDQIATGMPGITPTAPAERSET